MEFIVFASLIGAIVSIIASIISGVKKNGKVKKWRRWAGICFGILLLSAILSSKVTPSEEESKSVKESSSVSAEVTLDKISKAVNAVSNLDNEYVQSIIKSSPEAYPNKTYEEAFGKFFSNPKWEYFKSEDGIDVVQFTGGCVYADKNVNVLMQFTISEDKTSYELGGLSFNDVPQTELVKIALLESAFELK